jgi:4-aminobutyrate---pyruvate transaminase
MATPLRGTNYSNDSMILGFSDLRRLRTERPLVITGGRGVFVIDERGRDYIEAVSSFYCAALGFSEEELIEAAIRQMRALPFYPSASHRTVPVVMELADKLAAAAPIPNAKVAFATTGSEANDSLIKFLWYANGYAGEPKRRKVITRFGSYHGGTIAMTALGGGTALHRSFGVPTDDSIFVTHPTGAAPGESEEAYADRLAEEVRQAIETAGPETVGAFFAEPISTAAGWSVPPEGYFRKIKRVCDDYGVRVFLDEVVTGFGRTGHMWGAQAFGVTPDCLTCAKGMSGAYQPISAVVMSDDFYRALEKGSDENGWFAHSGTYHAHPVPAAVALKTLEIFERRRIVSHVRSLLPAWQRAIEALEDHPLVATTRNFGLGGAVEFKRTAEPAEGNVSTLKVSGTAKKVYEAGLDAGILTRPLDRCVVLAPPLIITEAEIGELFQRLRRAMDAVLDQKVSLS